MCKFSETLRCTSCIVVFNQALLWLNIRDCGGPIGVQYINSNLRKYFVIYKENRTNTKSRTYYQAKD